MKRAVYEVKEFLFYFILFTAPALCLCSLFFTLKAMFIMTGSMMVAFFIFCVVCYILQTRKEKKRAAKAKLKRSEV